MERIAVERLRVGLRVSMQNVPGTGFLLRSEVPPITEPEAAATAAGGIEIVAAPEPHRLEGEGLAHGPRVSGFDDEPATAPPTDALDAQRQSLDRCERRFSAVSKAFRDWCRTCVRSPRRRVPSPRPRSAAWCARCRRNRTSPSGYLPQNPGRKPRCTPSSRARQFG